MNTTQNINTATNISAGTFFPFSLEGIAPGTTVIVGRSANAGNLGDVATYLGITLDGLAVVRFEGITVDLGAGPGVEEWPATMVESLQAVA